MSELCHWHDIASGRVTRRVAKDDIELSGVTFTHGWMGIVAEAQSASRDEGVFSYPENFDVLRFVEKEKVGRERTG
ncbi:hypothetical protein K504DRAFT_458367 [Pleomassaria siparia CBS 279.74]|uniref:Uncharacterized protein n=1 Tax=Pleomassaria siparia CBS 279.74 TaxID=1314801 RepID=A0A6G1K4Z2_9PLEO|nr:hypothetical protein K504DRAFT_458367 [Pleomassaria siparia CBS 279.74]